MIPVDQQARDQIRSDLSTSFLVEAAPGTGKTYELVERIVAAVAGGADIESIVAITFTRKAAGELKLRLRRALELRSSGDDSAARACSRAAAHLEEAHVGTIDSFCAEILRQHPVEAEIDPNFSELGDGEDERLFFSVFDTWFDDQLQEPSEVLSRMLARPRSDRSKSMRELLRASAWDLAQNAYDYDAAWPTEDEAPVAECLDVLRQLILQKDSEIQGWVEKNRQPASWWGPIESTARWLQRFGPAQEPPRSQLEARLLDLKKERSLPADIEKQLTTLAARIDSDLAARMRLELLQIVELFEQAKRELGACDFNDLRFCVRRLLGGKAEVRQQCQLRFERIFVDEFQDTSRLQLEIVQLLTADDPKQANPQLCSPRPGALFLVGDPKQSIYRFRGADPELYLSIRKQLQSKAVQLLQLNHSFRATQPVQKFINAAYRQALDGQLQPGFSPLEGGQPAPEHVSVVALPVPRLLGNSQLYPNKAKVHGCFATTVAAFISWMTERSGWTVRDPDDDQRRVAIRPEHVAILFKRLQFKDGGAGFRDFTQGYREALDRYELPYGMVGMRSFFERPEVEALNAVARALEWPEDELSLYAALRGGLFSFNDALLMKARLRWRRLDMRTSVDDPGGEFKPLVEALGFLRALSEQRNERPFVETLQRLLSFSRVHVPLLMEPGGANLLANVQGVLELARSYETRGGISWRGFLVRLEEETVKAKSNDNRAFEAQIRGVRMMSTWQAKGLEFPVVILADPGGARQSGPYVRRVQRPQDRLLLTDVAGLQPLALADARAEENQRMEADAQRLAYVAATRARDILVFGATGATRLKAIDGWTRELDEFARSAPVAPAAQGQTCHDEVQQLAAGRHELDHEAVVDWVDLTELDFERQALIGLRQEGLLASDVPAAASSLKEHQSWRAERQATLRAGARPSLALLRPTDPEAPAAPKSYPIHVEVLPRAPDRPRGTRFGVLLHQAFAELDLDAEPEQIAAVAQNQARQLGASEEEIEAAVIALAAILKHGLLSRVRSAEASYRELPFTWATADGLLVDGSADLVFRDAHGWGVLELKTNADSECDREAHERQLRWYLSALEDADLSPVYGALLYV